VEDSAMLSVYSIRDTVHSMVDEDWYYASVWGVVLMWPVGIHESDSDGFSGEHGCRVEGLHFIDPLRHRIVIHLLDSYRVHHVLSHVTIVVAVYFGAAE